MNALYVGMHTRYLCITKLGEQTLSERHRFEISMEIKSLITLMEATQVRCFVLHCKPTKLSSDLFRVL
jgi:hypothetical protein